MTIDDLPRTYDVTGIIHGPVSGVDITAVPGFGTETAILEAGIPVPVAPPLEPYVSLGDPDPHTGMVRGSVRIVGEQGRAVRFEPELATTARGGLVAVDPGTGRFTYTPSVPARQIARTSTDFRDKVDTFTVEVVDAHDTRSQAHVVVHILAADVLLSGAALVGRPSPNGVLTGRIDAAAWDGARLTFSLANPANPADSTTESAVSENGGLVQLDPDTGEFLFVPPVGDGTAAPDIDRFVVTAIDPRGATADITVVAKARLTIEAQTRHTAPGVARGRLALDDDTPLTFSLGAAPSKGIARVDQFGGYLYTRAPGARGSAEDRFSILGTDGYGRSITVATIAVCPPLDGAWSDDSAHRTVGASGRGQGLSTGDWTTTVAGLSPDATYSVHQPEPHGFVMMARTAPGKWAVHYESMTPKADGRHPGERFTVRYQDGQVAPDGTPAVTEVTYVF